MNSLRVVFMGTPDFAVPTLQALIDGPNEVVGVFANRINKRDAVKSSNATC